MTLELHWIFYYVWQLAIPALVYLAFYVIFRNVRVKVELKIPLSHVHQAILRQEMDRHPIEYMEPGGGIGLSVRPGDLRKRPVFGRDSS